MGLINMVFNLI